MTYRGKLIRSRVLISMLGLLGPSVGVVLGQYPDSASPELTSLLFIHFETHGMQIRDVSTRWAFALDEDEVMARAQELSQEIENPESDIWLIRYEVLSGNPTPNDDRVLRAGHFLASRRVSVEVLKTDQRSESVHRSGATSQAALRLPIPYSEGARRIVIKRCDSVPMADGDNRDSCQRFLHCYSLVEENHACTH